MLWTNSSPTSAFGTQTITILNDSAFEYIMLIYDAYVPYENYCTYFLKRPNADYKLPFFQLLYDNNGVTIRERYLRRMSSTRWYFSNGDVNGSNNNDVCVPVKIIGIKSI